MKHPIYLDYNATTAVDERVIKAMLPYFNAHYGNPSSITHAFGWDAVEAIKVATTQIKSLINCDEQELIYTSGATEAINLAIKGVWENYQFKGKHIITVKTEHKAVLDVCQSLERQGATITYLSVNSEGLINLDELKSVISDKTILVAVMYVNNETGVMQPIDEIAEIVHQHKSIFMCDATQAVGKISIDLSTDKIDLMCMSAHKMYGPKGIGALYVRRKKPRVVLAPQIHGGGHQRGLRSGTLNVPGIVGLGKACEIAKTEMDADKKRISALHNFFESSIATLNGVYINGSQSKRIYTTSNITLKGINSAKLISKIPQLAISMGSACSAANTSPSHVLKAMQLSDEDAFSTIRVSIGKHTTGEQIDEAIHSLSKQIKANSAS